MTPRHYPCQPLGDRGGLMTRRIGSEPTESWTEPRFFEWELRGQSWSDEHPHSEFVYVLAGHLQVEAAGVTVECGPGDLVEVPAGSIGIYRAPDHARMLSIYGPNPDGRETRLHGLKKA